MAPIQENSPWYSELDDILRAVSGAFLFGIPLLYTMEVWWTGNTVEALHIALSLGASLSMLILLDYVAGFRKKKRYRWKTSLMDSLVALAIAVICSGLSLKVIGVLPLNLGLQNILGRVTMEAIPFAIGAGISDYLVEGQKTTGREINGQEIRKKVAEDKSARGKLHGTLVDMGAAALGAIIIGFSIAPTDEILLIAGRLSSPDLLILMTASLVITYTMVFESSFVSENKLRQQRGIFQHPIVETISSYLVALGISLFMLWLFRTLGAGQSWNEWLEYTIVLGFPASIGGAAGRIAV